MANYFAPLPTFRPGPGINLEPVNSALDTIMQQQNIDRQFGLQQQASDRADRMMKIGEGQFDLQKQSAARQQVADFGKQALAVDQITDPAQRAAAWKQIISRHGTNGLTPEELDPASGPKLMAAQAGQFLDPLDRETKVAGLELTRAQIKAADQKNSLNDAIAGLITGGSGASGSPPPVNTTTPMPGTSVTVPQPRFQPQSFQGAPTMPGVVLASDTSTVPGSPAAPQPQQPEMVDTPLGPMTPDRARSAGFALSLAGKDAAGKALMDAGSSAALDKGATTQNDKEELASTGQLATLNSIKSTYQSKFLNIPQRFQFWGAAVKDKFGALGDQDKKDLTAYTQFRQNAWHNLNRVLKDLSGTAVTENEMQRQLLDLPNPGKGIFDGDSPTEFDAKLKNSIAFQTSAIARARWLRSKGFRGKPWEARVAVEDMPAIINQRGQEIEQEFRQQHPNATPMQLQQATTRQIKQEFGI
jgi:hypothetical protein